MRMKESDRARKVLGTKPGGTGYRRGTPKLRWFNEVEEDIARVVCRNWIINAQSGDEWWKLIENVKSHSGT
jgi:hypothetical protein